MKIRMKLVLGHLIIALLAGLVGFFSYFVSRNVLWNTLERGANMMSHDILSEVNDSISFRVAFLKETASEPDVVKFVIEANKYFDSASSRDRERIIDETDQAWRKSGKDSPHELAIKLLSNSLSRKLRFRAKFYNKELGGNIFPEIFITNKYGVNVAQTGLTTDYRQNDEEWWKRARENGVYVSPPEYDESSQSYSIIYCARLQDNAGNFIGVLKGVVGLAGIFKSIETDFHSGEGNQFSSFLGFEVVDSDGKLIYGTDDESLTSEEESERALLSRSTKEGLFIQTSGNRRMLLMLTKGSGDVYGEWLRHLGWVLLLKCNVDEIFKPVRTLRNMIVVLVIVVVALAFFLSVLLSNSISIPIERLREKTELVSVGDLDEELVATSNDEIGDLTEHFNIMVQRLKNSMVSRDYVENIFKSMSDSLIILDSRGLMQAVNKSATVLLGCHEEALVGKPYGHIVAEGETVAREFMDKLLREEVIKDISMSYQTRDGAKLPVSLSGAVVKDGEGKIKNFICIARDISERNETERKLKKALRTLDEANMRLKENQRQLLQSEKLASIGQLAAGVAHEINNPMGFIGSNLRTLKGYVESLKKVLNRYAELTEVGRDERDAALDELKKMWEEEDLDYVFSDIDGLLDESLDGADRVGDIVKNLKSFARADDAEIVMIDVNEGIESTLKVVWNELKYKCEVVKTLRPVPKILGNAGKLNQVFMNLLVNAAHSIKERGTVKIETEADDEVVVIRFSDTGCGIPEEVVSKIFDPFFTTKEPGKGTGLGLSIVHGIIQEHHGVIDVVSEVGKGTVFTVKLPIEQEENANG